MDAHAGTLTLVFTDIEDSAAHSERFRAAFEPTRDLHFRLLRAGLNTWQGSEIKSAGDSLFVVFNSAAAAAQWAVHAQRALTEYAWPSPVGAVRVRMGLHTGEPFLSSDPQNLDYFGPAVNRAARIMGAAHGGQILISDTTRVLAQGELPPDILLRELGLHRLKGVGEERLWQIRHADLPDLFPSLLTLNPERHNLPIPPTPFIGREREILAWHTLLTGEPLSPEHRASGPTTRLLTLCGFGGMGKTRAALHLAELCVERFAHGVCWVEMEGAGDSDELLLRLAQSLRLDVSSGMPLREQVFAFLREREMLLALDNTEGIPDIVPLVRDLLQAAPNVRFLVTTRRALELRGETVVELRPLPEADAQRLFVERARACRDDFAVNEDNARDVAALCRRLEGVPLALELAAARITGMTPRQMLPRLNERFKLLQSRSPDLPPRQRALRAAIDWSYNLLEEEERGIYAQLSVFAGGFTMEDAEAVCEGFDVFESVLELRRNSFFRVETDLSSQQDRFFMLDSLRDYANERLRERAEAEEVGQRHGDYFLQFAREQTARFRRPGEAAAMRALARNAENLRAALTWATGAGCHAQQAELGLLLGLALQRHGYHAQAVGSVQEGLDVLASERSSRPALYLELLLERAGLALETGDVDGGARMAGEAREWAQAHGNADGIGKAEILLGWAAMDANDYATARTHYQAARQQGEAVQDTTLMGVARNNLGIIERRDPQGNADARAEHLQAALKIRRTQGDTRGQAETLTNLGVLAYDQQKWDEAWRFYAEALTLERELDNLFGMALALSNLGEVALEQAKARLACRLFGASERLIREIGSSYGEDVAAYLTRAATAAALTPDACRRESEPFSLHDLSEWAMQIGD